MSLRKYLSPLFLILILFLAVGVGIINAQTAITPGAPDTGGGGNSMFNAILLVASVLVASLGSAYLGRKRFIR
ncbi:hypothetical protein HYW53_00030 [Candidatus Giovannonibacteria bacterium]|nr:hypothetical protein [Candidatus Giovannonibacteria bacterium]